MVIGRSCGNLNLFQVEIEFYMQMENKMFPSKYSNGNYRNRSNNSYNHLLMINDSSFLVANIDILNLAR